MPGLRGLSCSEFRASATEAPDFVSGVAVELESETAKEDFLRQLEAEFAARRFGNAADAFDTVKAYALEKSTERLASFKKKQGNEGLLP